MIKEDRGYIFIIENRNLSNKIEFFISLFEMLHHKGFLFLFLDGDKIVKLSYKIEKEEVMSYFGCSINDCNNEKWVFAIKFKNVIEINFEECEFLDCFIPYGISIFTQYDSDGIEFQISNQNYDICEELIEVFNKIKVKEGF